MNPSNVPAEQRIESIGFYIFLVSVILAPIIFWPSPYIALDTVKTIVIALGVLISAILLGLIALKEKRLTLPPRKIFWISLLIVASLIVSGLFSIHSGKSLFGQGFEINTVSFIAILFVGGLVAFTLIRRRLDRAILLYVGIFVAYFIVFMFQVLRLLFGTGFASFSVFMSQTSSILGGWFNVGTYSAVIALVSLSAILFLSLSRKMKIVYGVLLVLSAVVAFVVITASIWSLAFLVLLGLTIFLSIKRIRSQNYAFGTAVKHIAWLPLVVCVIALVLTWKGASIAGPIINSAGLSYSEASLPWQATLDVTSGVIKAFPIFGVGPSHFTEAYMNFKPDAINMGDGWNLEFTTGFGLIPTLVAEQGIVGLVLWILFFVFLGLIGAKALKNSGGKSPESFILVSSYISTVFLWLVAISSVPSHAVLFLTFIMTGIFLGSSVFNGASKPIDIEPKSTRGSNILKIILVIAIVLAAIWALICLKKVIALSYFGSGVKQLTVDKNPDLALASFSSAYGIDRSDVYLQGKVEAELSKATLLATQTSNSTTPENVSSSDALIKQVGDIVNAALLDARAAIAYDPSDYYNYISEARVSEVATNLKMQNAYENAVNAYIHAINLDPKNPSIYLNLAKLEVNQNKLDDSIKAIGAALQLKSNYLDAVFLLSQVYAAKGDLSNAIIAAQFASQLNPQNPQVFFQLGLLQYNNKQFDAATTSFATAIKLQPDYANAQYFLGLSYAQLGKNDEAIAQFAALSKTNPDNQEVLNILKTLSAGKSIFNNPQEVASPAKRPALPIKTKK